MTHMLDGSVIRMFRLVDGPNDLGLSCNRDGLFLAGVPLLHKTQAGFEPRPAAEIASLLKAAYGADEDSIRLQSSLGSIARALNSGDFALAAIAAVQTRTPELSREAAARLVHVDKQLTKRNLTKFDPDELRDLHGRWTTGGSAGSAAITAPAGEGAANQVLEGGWLLSVQSMLDVAGTAAVFTDGAPRLRPSTKPIFEDAPNTPAQAPNDVEGVGAIAPNSEAEIKWKGGIKEQGLPWEDYVTNKDPRASKLQTGATTFDHFNADTGEAISSKTLDTLTMTYIRKPQEIFKKVSGYIEDAKNYVPEKAFDVDPAKIKSKTLYLAIPEYTSSTVAADPSRDNLWQR
jgi:hypothetical protein